MKRRAWFLFPLILLCSSAPSFGQLWSGIIDPSRTMDWSKAGAPGVTAAAGWPNCTTSACNTLWGGNVTADNINTAITSAPDNSVVRLPAGTFTMNHAVLFGTGGGTSRSNVVLRGMGADQTTLDFSGSNNGYPYSCQGLYDDICFQSGDISWIGDPHNLTNWTGTNGVAGTYTQGATSITLGSVANLSVGSLIMLDQLDDPSDNGAINVCSTTACAINGDGGVPRRGRAQQQVVTVTAIIGTTVTISPGIVMPNWRTSQTPQAWWASSNPSNSGVENLSITIGGNRGLGFFWAKGCWAKGIRSVGPPNRSHGTLSLSAHITIQDSYFYQTADSASVNYGIETDGTSDDLIQNNIFEQVQAPYPADGSCTGCVFAYNFDVNNVFSGGTWQNQSGFPHAPGDEHMLYEGNIGSGVYSDNFHGSHHFQTIFRNYWNGYQKNEGNFTTGHTTPLLLFAISRFYNVVGNVLGNPAVHTTASSLIAIGDGDANVPSDANTGTTLMRWGNFLNCSGSSPCQTSVFSSSEVPDALTGTQAPFSNPVPASQTLPASFYLSAKPSGWTSGKPWPAIGPDVTGGNVKYCAGGTQAGTYVLTSGQCPGGTATTLAGGRIYSNPAMDCYLNMMGGSPDGTGGVLTFNAASCYTSSGGGGGLNPPSGLAAVVN